MEGKKYRKHRKAQEAARLAAAQSQPIYHKGVRTDVPDAGMERPKGKGKPPMDPRYPPARYVRPDDFAYGGPTVVLPANAPLIVQPHLEKKSGFGPNFYLWAILGAVLIAISLTIVFVAFYVMGEFTESSPVFKGYFG